MLITHVETRRVPLSVARAAPYFSKDLLNDFLRARAVVQVLSAPRKQARCNDHKFLIKPNFAARNEGQ